MALYLRNKEQTGFVYKWTHIPTQKWYVGSRTAKGCHQADGYNSWSFRSKGDI